MPWLGTASSMGASGQLAIAEAEFGTREQMDYVRRDSTSLMDGLALSDNAGGG